ncbi:MAG: hypothetical protein FWG71_11115, partial [Synergistaceae bacterium]|nr:hypothetical protein [Synergistaceae bacterium]
PVRAVSNKKPFLSEARLIGSKEEGSGSVTETYAVKGSFTAEQAGHVAVYTVGGKSGSYYLSEFEIKDGELTFDLYMSDYHIRAGDIPGGLLMYRHEGASVGTDGLLTATTSFDYIDLIR